MGLCGKGLKEMDRLNNELEINIIGAKLLPKAITRRQNFRVVQIETNCRQHFKVHLQ